MVSIETISIVIAAVSVVIGVILSLNSRKQELETRQAELFMQIYTKWSDPKLAEQYGLVRYKYGDQNLLEFLPQVISAGEQFNTEAFVAYHSLLQFFEGISVLVHKKLIDLDLVERLLSQRIVWYWDLISPWIKQRRTLGYRDTHYLNIEKLYQEMIKREQLTTIGT